MVGFGSKLNKIGADYGRKTINTIKKGAKVAGAVAAVGALVGTAVLADKGLEKKKELETQFEQKKQEAQAGITVGRAVGDIAAAGAREAASNPLGAKQELQKTKKMIKGVALAAKEDPIGAEDQIRFVDDVKRGSVKTEAPRAEVGGLSGQGFGAGGIDPKASKKEQKAQKKAIKKAAKAEKKAAKKAAKAAKKKK
jgi:hypothetical protein